MAGRRGGRCWHRCTGGAVVGADTDVVGGHCAHPLRRRLAAHLALQPPPQPLVEENSPKSTSQSNGEDETRKKGKMGLHLKNEKQRLGDESVWSETKMNGKLKMCYYNFDGL